LAKTTHPPTIFVSKQPKNQQKMKEKNEKFHLERYRTGGNLQSIDQ